MDKDTQKIQRLQKKVEQLEAERKIFYEEMVARGEEISRMIRIFLAICELLPDRHREQIEKLARQYAERNDKDRGSCYCPGEIEFRSDGNQGICKRKAERFNDMIHKVSL